MEDSVPFVLRRLSNCARKPICTSCFRYTVLENDVWSLQTKPTTRDVTCTQKSNQTFIRTAGAAHAIQTSILVNLLRNILHVIQLLPSNLTDTKKYTAGSDKIDRNSFWPAGTLGFLARLLSGSSSNVVTWGVICVVWQQKFPRNDRHTVNRFYFCLI